MSASVDNPACATASSDHAPSGVESPRRETPCYRLSPFGFAAVFLLAGFRVGNPMGILNLVLIKANRRHALGQEPATVRIDQPPGSKDPVHAEKAGARQRRIVDNAAPPRSRRHGRYTDPLAPRTRLVSHLTSDAVFMVTVSTGKTPALDESTALHVAATPITAPIEHETNLRKFTHLTPSSSKDRISKQIALLNHDQYQLGADGSATTPPLRAENGCPSSEINA
jgi:hypothetical protein